MSWLGNGFREEAKSLADAYASMYEAAEQSEVIEEGGSYDKKNTRHLNPNVKAKPSMDPDSNLNVKEEAEELEENRFAAYGGKSTDPGAAYAKPGKGAGGKTYTMKGKDGKPLFPKVEEADLLAALQDAYSMMYEKKKDSDKCGEGTYWDSEEKKCKKKKSSKTTVIVGRGGYYGGGHHHGGSDGGDTDGGDTEGGTEGGGDGGGGGE